MFFRNRFAFTRLLFTFALAASLLFALGMTVTPLAVLPVWATATRPQSSAQKAPSSPAEKSAGEVFKNVRALKDVPESQFMPAMFVIAASLGVTCGHCHVTSDTGPWPLEKDDKDTKKTARKMIEMVQAINDQNFAGKQEVNCATCHQGHAKPVSAAPVIALGAKHQEDAGDAKNFPPADQILDKYVEAVGGAEALARVHTRTVKGTLIGESGRSYTLEIVQRAPDAGLMTITFPDGSKEREAFDGAVAWNESGGHAFGQAGLEKAKIVRNMQFFIATDVRVKYPLRAVEGKETVGDEEAWVVHVSGSGNVSERLDFSIRTGLLLRRSIAARTALGPFTEQTDYLDYREVDGVRLPYTIRRMEINTRWTEKYSDVRQNVPVDDALFQNPAPGK
jgi:photosynthetic reaction center cytochrome c subunit